MAMMSTYKMCQRFEIELTVLHEGDDFDVWSPAASTARSIISSSSTPPSHFLLLLLRLSSPSRLFFVFVVSVVLFLIYSFLKCNSFRSMAPPSRAAAAVNSATASYVWMKFVLPFFILFRVGGRRGGGRGGGGENTAAGSGDDWRKQNRRSGFKVNNPEMRLWFEPPSDDLID